MIADDKKDKEAIVMSKRLVAFFSASGNSKKIAQTLAEAAGADLYEITPRVAYTSADLNWMDKKSRSSVEMKDKKIRPELGGESLDIDPYDEIVLGFPIWWYVAPTIINTFLEAHDFTGKTIRLFATSGGSGISKAEKSLREHCPGGNWKKGRLVNSGAAEWAGTMLGK